MRAQLILGFLFVLVFTAAEWKCGKSNQPSPTTSTTCIDFEAPLTAGTLYGSPTGQNAGTVIFTTKGVPVSLNTFELATGAGVFNEGGIDLPPVAFASGQSLRINNVTVNFDFTGLGTVSQVTFKFLDEGGIENLSLNNSFPFYVGELSFAPSPINGIAVSSSGSGGTGNISLIGPVQRLTIGGQEFWIDDVCVVAAQ